MKNVTRHTGTLEIIQHLGTSANGNPRYLISIDGYRAKTQVDSMLGYEVPNYDGKYCSVTLGTHYNTLTLDTINPA